MDILAKSLAPVLGYSEEEVRRWLDAVFQRIAEELVLRGKVHLADLGVLQRIHIPAEPREVDGKLMLVPPRHEVKFIQEPVLENGIVFDVGIEQLQLKEEVAQKFSKGFARVVQKVIEVRSALQIGELGEFVRDERAGLIFKQSPILSELLNKPFVGLSPVMISEHRETVTATAPTVSPAHQSVSAELKVAHVSEPLSESVQPISVTMQGAESETEPVNELTSASANASCLKDATLLADNPPEPTTEFSQIKETHLEEADKSIPTLPTEDKPHREPLFIALAAAAKAKPETEEERRRVSQKYKGEDNGAPFRYEMAVPTKAPSKSMLEELPSDSGVSSVENPSTWADSNLEDLEEDRDAPVLRNVAIATAIVFFTIIIAFIVMKYDSISLTPPTPPAPVDRAKIEAEKAAAARAEAERILAEKSIPKRPAYVDSSMKIDGLLLKNITKAAAGLPPELTTIDLSKGGYTIIVASQPTREDAVALAEEFAKLGLAATVMEKKVGKTIRYRVRVGQFATAAAARAAKKKYKRIIPEDAFLDKVSEPLQ